VDVMMLEKEVNTDGTQGVQGCQGVQGYQGTQGVLGRMLYNYEIHKVVVINIRTCHGKKLILIIFYCVKCNFQSRIHYNIQIRFHIISGEYSLIIPMENPELDMKLIELPVLCDVFSFLDDGLYDGDIFTLGSLNKKFREFFTYDPCMDFFWYKQLRRAAHKNVDIVSCYPEMKLVYSQFTGYMLYQNNLDKIRHDFGECSESSHLRFKVPKFDPIHGFDGRCMYNEWQRVMWKRMKTKYWNHYDEKRMINYEKEILRLRAEINLLQQKKTKHQKLQELYENIKTKLRYKKKKKK
jgi:hypothetical protein